MGPREALFVKLLWPLVEIMRDCLVSRTAWLFEWVLWSSQHDDRASARLVRLSSLETSKPGIKAAQWLSDQRCPSRRCRVSSAWTIKAQTFHAFSDAFRKTGLLAIKTSTHWHARRQKTHHGQTALNQSAGKSARTSKIRTTNWCSLRLFSLFCAQEKLRILTKFIQRRTFIFY